jgi:hypothetical protein
MVAIKRNRGISNAAKLSLGLNLLRPARLAVPAPSTSPILSVIGATPGVHTIRFADEDTPNARAKPAGAIAMQLFRAVGERAASDPRQATYYASVTRQPFAVTFDHADNGKVATYFARWITRTGLVGPWSRAVSSRVEA